MWPNLQFPTDLVTCTEEILNRKLRFLCSEYKRVLISFLELERSISRNKIHFSECVVFLIFQAWKVAS